MFTLVRLVQIEMSKAVWISEEVHAKIKEFAIAHGLKVSRLGEYFILEGLKQVEGVPLVALATKIEHQLGKEHSGGIEIERQGEAEGARIRIK